MARKPSSRLPPLGKIASRGKIAFQGEIGSYSHHACRMRFPGMTPLPCATFEDAIAAVHDRKAKLAMIAVDNSVAGRVADVHHLLPGSGLKIVGEHFQPIHHHLLVVPGASLKTLKTAESHIHALSQCRNFLRTHKLKAVVATDTAGAARDVAQRQDKTVAAIASASAGQIYGLKSLKANIEDEKHNTTRFLIMAREPIAPRPGEACVTSMIFRLKSVPAALYKALGGFATAGINLTKLESYMVGGFFKSAEFYAEVEGRPDEKGFKHALMDLGLYTERVDFLGTYPADPFRFKGR
ncbi:MAG: prephenate dehydratase [Rhodospirillaceae bacterium]|nr:prephenate dehydratase [Rhodospirillaceae bacterium]